ncbi:MAG: sulfurtransferase complex subunit TusB [Pseudomonadales bacterium]
MKLHTVNKSPMRDDAMSQCLSVAASGSCVLLLEDGVYGALRGGSLSRSITDALDRLRIFALAPDVTARGLDAHLVEGVALVDYDGFVRLTIECDAVVPWH